MKTLPLLRMCGRLLSLLMLMLLVLVVNGGPRVAAVPQAPLATYTEPFDTDGNWVNVTGATLSAYGTKQYSNSSHL